MTVRLSVDPDAVRAYGAASAEHAADLQAAATRLRGVGADTAALGPVGARFLAAVTRAAAREAAAVGAVGSALLAARGAAVGSAEAYETADGRVFGGR